MCRWYQQSWIGADSQVPGNADWLHQRFVYRCEEMKNIGGEYKDNKVVILCNGGLKNTL